MTETQPPRQPLVAKTTQITHSIPRLFSGVLIVCSVIAAVGLIIKFPNLRTNLAYLILVVVTPLLLAGSVVYVVSGFQRHVPRIVSGSLLSLLALVVALDLVAFAGPLVVAGPQGQDSAPAFVAATPAQSGTPVSGVPTATASTVAAPRAGQFDARPGVDTASGRASLGYTSDGSLILSLQDLHSANGPDLHVYLTTQAIPTTAEQVMHGYEVGTLKATTGTVNYALPTTLEAGNYHAVVIFCKSFSVIFGYATLA